MVYILNGISVSMFQVFPVTIEINMITPEEVAEIIRKAGKKNVSAVINRKDIAQDVSNLLDLPITLSTKKVFPEMNDEVIIVRHKKIAKSEMSANLITPNKTDIEFYLMSRY